MDDKVFKREQVRRNVQEMLNSLDESLAFEEGSKEQNNADLTWVLKLFALSLECNQIVKTFVAAKAEDTEEA